MAKMKHSKIHYNPGMGIYQFASLLKNDPAAEDIGQENDYSVNNPYVSGTVIYCSWKEIEPEEKAFRWDKIDALMQPWIINNKRCILRICPCRREIATPDWVFRAGAHYISQKGMQTHTQADLNYENKIPVYWDPVFLEKYEALIKEFGKRYDRDPNVEAIQIALGKWGESFLGSEVDLGPIKNTLSEWVKEGYTISRAIETFKRIIMLYKKYFVQTPLIVMIGGPFVDNLRSSESAANTEEIAAFCVENGIFLQQNGFSPNYNNFLNTTKIFDRYYRKTKVMYEIYHAKAMDPDVMQKTVRNMLKEHVSYAFLYTKNLNHNCEKTKEVLDYFFHRIGYQIDIKEINIPDKTANRCTIGIVWENKGCAPVYFDFRLTVLAFDKSGKKVGEIPATIVPGTEMWTEHQQIFSKMSFQFPSSFSPGEYDLRLLISERIKKHPVYITNEKRLISGTPEIILGRTRLVN